MASTEFEQKVVDSLARLETHMQTIVGDSTNPGRIPKLESKVEELQKDRNWFAGVAIGASTVLSGLVHVLWKKG